MADASVLLHETRRELGRLPAALAALLAGIDDASARRRPAPAEWAPVEIVCHLRDEETEDFGARVRAIVEGGEFSPIDPERWAGERRYQDDSLAAALEALYERRRANLAWLAGIAPEALAASRRLRGGGMLSGLDLCAAWVAHDGLHLRQLAGTLTRLWSLRWDGLRTEYAGPIPYAPDSPA
jgi:DinB family protein